jgi:circadian clock protein KaiB
MTSRLPLCKFRLYIAGHAPNSLRAIANLTAFCRHHLPDRHVIELVDLLQEPHRALADGILLTPTLVRHSPLPSVTVLGNLADLETISLLPGPASAPGPAV